MKQLGDFMLKTRIVCYLLTVVLLSISTSEAYTKVGRTKKKNKQKSNMVYSPIKYNLLLKGNLGYITNSDDFSTFYKPDDKIYYGFGAAFEYHTEGRHAIGIHYDRLYKSYNSGYDGKLLLQVYTASYIFKFRTKKTTIPFATINFGTAKPDIRKAKSVKTFKIGIGFIGHTAGKINLRGLIYYQQFIEDDKTSFYLADGILNVAGLEISMGIPL